MKITVKTKFSIGDLVYVAVPYYEYYVDSEPYTIVGITIRLNDHAVKIVYNIEKDNIIDSVSENFVFATYAECLEWCDNKNEEENYDENKNCT